MIRKKGFTLTELLAVIAILSLLVGLATVTILNVRDNVLEQSYENVVNLLETEAANYAEDTGIMTVTVEDLITEGYVLPDDETDIYNPVNNESLNCHLISSVFENGEYVSTFGEDIGKTDGTCNVYEKNADLVICRYNADHSECVELGDNWLNENITLGVKIRNSEKEESIKSDEYTYAWQSSDGSYSAEYFITTNTNMIFQGNYSARVTFSPNEISEANKEIKIDLQSPVVVNAILDESETVSGWAQKKYATITGSDFSGSGVAGIFAGKADTCTPDLTYQEVNANNQVSLLLEEDENLICVKDNAGNVSNSDYVIDNNLVDAGIDEFSIKFTPDDFRGYLNNGLTRYTRSGTLSGSVQDIKSGLVAYQFVGPFEDKEDVTYTNNWNNVNPSPTKEEITVTDTKSGVTQNGYYYICGKDALNNEVCTDNPVLVDSIDREIDGNITLTQEIGTTNEFIDSGYGLNFKLEATASDSKAGLVGYQFVYSKNNSPSTPSANASNWNLMSTPRTTTFNTSYTATSNGYYKFCVLDAAGNVDCSDAIRVTNVVVEMPYSNTLYSENIQNQSGSFNATSAVKGIKNYSTDTGSISVSYNGNYIYYNLRNGRTYSGTRTDTCHAFPNSYRADREYYCSRYRCPYGSLSGDRCVADGPTTDYFPGDNYPYTCHCGPSKTYDCWFDSGSPSTSGVCGPGYYRVDSKGYDCPWENIQGNRCTSDRSGRGHCYAKCRWEGNFDADCVSEDYEYTCDYGDVERNGYCYYCNTGYINSNGTDCSYSCPVSYSYWRYNISIIYYVVL